MARIEAANGWVKTTCTVEDSRVTTTPYERIDGKKTVNHFFASFEVNGTRYGCFTPSLFEGDKRVVSRILGRTKPGSSVDIYHCPEKPYKNVLIAPLKHGSLVNTMLFILSVILLSLFTLFFFI
nr:hypothetical protein [Psychromonas sp. SP041]